MTNKFIDGLRLISCSYHIDFPYSSWTSANSYLVCRALVDNYVIEGTAMIGTRMNKEKDAINKGDRGIYTVGNTQYGWINLPDNSVLDPCHWLHEQLKNEPQFIIQADKNCYVGGINPIICDRREIPKHYEPDAIFVIKRGVMRELCSRILGYELQVESLTMAEVAYISSRPLSEFGSYARLIYEHFITLGLSKLLPITKVSRVHPSIARRHSNLFWIDIDGDELRAITHH